MFILFFIGFIIKLPSFPFHTWLPDAHVEAPTPISMILAGILLKIGGYGLIRLAWPLAPAGAYDWSYVRRRPGRLQHPLRRPGGDGPDRLQEAGRLQLGQPHGLRHPGHGRHGIFAADGSALDPRYYAYGVNGAMFMMLAHGITSAGMFFLVGVIYDRAHTRDLNKLGGLDNIMPLYGAMSYIIFFGSMGLPGLCGFVAEVFVVLAAFNYSPVLAVLAAAAVILTAGYILWTIQRVFLGRSEAWKGLPDMNLREIVIAVPLVVLTIAMGIFPQSLVLSWMGPSVDQVVQKVMTARELNVQRPAPRPGSPRSPSSNRRDVARVRDARSCSCVDPGSRCTLRATSDAARGNVVISSRPGDCAQSSRRRREGAAGPSDVRLVRSSSISAPRVAERPEGLEPCPGWVADVLWKEPNCHASQVMDGRSRLDRSHLDPVIGRGLSAQAPGPAQEPSPAKEAKKRRRKSAAESAEGRAEIRLAAREAQGVPRRTSPPSSSTSSSPGWGPRAVTSRSSRPTPGCKFRPPRPSTSRPTARPRIKLRDVELRGADKTCTMAITVREPGQPPQTIYRGFRPGSSKTGTVPSFTCFVSSKLAGVDAKATRK